MGIRTKDSQKRDMTGKASSVPPVILVVEQEQPVRGFISSTLRTEGYVVLAVADGELAADIARDNPLSLLVVDVLRLGLSGLAICHQVRSTPETAHVPLLLLLADASEIAQIESQGVRGDDYLLKPLVWEELSACVTTLLHERRHRSTQKMSRITHSASQQAADGDEQVLIVENLTIDIARRTVMRDDQPLDLSSALLFDLLVYLVRHRGIVLSREQLLGQVWGYQSASRGARETRTLSVHMHWLREVLGDDPAHPQFIDTVRGVGYRFKA